MKTHPFGQAGDELTEGLKAALEGANTKARETWAEFDTARQKALDDLHETYLTAAGEAEDLQQRLMKRLTGKAEGGIPAGHEGRPDGIGAEFLRRIGAGVAGLKALDGTSGGSMVPPFFSDSIRELPQRQLFVRSVIPVQEADSDKVWWLRQDVATNNAAPVAAGAVKPTSVYTVSRQEQPIVTIAHVTEALDRALLSDFDELVSFLDGQLRLGVLLSEENQILNGNGTAPNLRGILNTIGIGSIARTTEPRLETLHMGITNCRSAFYEPDAIVLHPTDWEEVLFEKNANEDYYAADVAEGDPAKLWGKTIITSPVIAEGTGLVGAFAVGARIWDREEARVTFTEAGLGDAAGQELFTRNQIRFRGEERIAFGVERPAAFCKVTNL